MTALTESQLTPLPFKSFTVMSKLNYLCTEPDCLNPKEGRTDRCASHNAAFRKMAKDVKKLQDKRDAALKKAKPPRTRVNKVSEKRKEQNAEYAILREAFLKENPKCACCGDPSQHVHHRAGRQNDMLLEKQYFMAVCDGCHREIHDNPEWARQQGYMILRTTV